LPEGHRTAVPQFMTESHIQRLKDLGVGEKGYKESVAIAHEKWQVRFDLLKEYKEEYKTCSFPSQVEKLEEKFRGLRPYISQMRRQVKRYKDNPASSKVLDEDKDKQLLDLEIEVKGYPTFDAGESCDPVTPDEQAEGEKEWQVGFALLQEYKEKYNTCSIPRQLDNLEDKFKQLAAFLRETRKQIKLYIEDPVYSSFLNEDKYNQLKDLGVQSSKRKDPATKAEEERTKWEEMFQNLKPSRNQEAISRLFPTDMSS
jgi:hypothetical protein